MKAISCWLNFQNERIGINIPRFLRNTSYIGIARMFAVGSGFLTVFAFSRFTTPEVYGKFTFLVSLVEVIAIVALPGLLNALVYSVAKGYEGTIIPIAYERLRYGFIGSVFLVGFAAYSEIVLNNREFFVCFMAASLIFPLSNAFSLYEAFLFGKRNFRKSATLQVISSVVVCASIITSLKINGGVVSVFLSRLIISGLLSGMFYFLILKRINHTIDPDAILYGKKLTLLNVLSIVQGRIELLLIPSLYSFGDLAFFYVGQRVADEYKTIWASLSSQMLPALAAKKPSEAHAFALSKLKHVIIGFAVGTLFLALIIPGIFTFVLTEKYRLSIVYAELMLLTSFFSIPGAYFETYMLSQKSVGKLAVLRFIYPVIYFGLMPFLIWGCGIKGFIYSKMGASICYSSVSYYLARKAS